MISGGCPGIMEAAKKCANGGKAPSVGLNIVLPHEQVSNSYQDISLTFRHFFARKVAFAKYASAFVAAPGGYGTLDELLEMLTLIQTGTGRRIPIILMGTTFWQGLLDWMRQTLLAEGMISEQDLALIRVFDYPTAVAEAIFDFHESRWFYATARAPSSNLSCLFSTHYYVDHS